MSLSVGVAIAAFFLEDILNFVMRPLAATLPPGANFIFTYPTEAFMLRIRIALIAGLFIATPLVFWQVWQFVAPALYAKERRYAIPFVLLSSIGFLGGAAFSHYVAFPLMWRFFASFSDEMIVFMPRIEDTFSMYMRMLLGMAAVFQMPAMVFFLARMGVVTARWMIRQFKYAILVDRRHRRRHHAQLRRGQSDDRGRSDGRSCTCSASPSPGRSGRRHQHWQIEDWWSFR